ncbi:ovostatin-like [Ornithodoros turicata]|uniref:ovostatin-like n=1 Tax=Ornithodoros turicata TaxID=34597 RepID=UPI0031399B1A
MAHVVVLAISLAFFRMTSASVASGSTTYDSGVREHKGPQPVSLNVTFPPYIALGEKASVIVTATSNVDQCIVVKAGLQATQNLNIVSAPCDIYASICRLSGTASFVFYVVPFAAGIGVLTATVEYDPEFASYAPGSNVYPHTGVDRAAVSLSIRPGGVVVPVTITYPICAEERLIGAGIYLGGILRARGRRSVCDTTALPGFPATGHVYATGDRMPRRGYIDVNPALTSLMFSYAEATLAYLTVNAYLYNYTQATGQDSYQFKENLIAAYERQKAFRARDGSYGSYSGADNERSVFLTAFAVQALADASSVMNDPTGISDAEIAQSIQYLKSLQDPSTGCYRETGQGNPAFTTPAHLTLYVGLSVIREREKDYDIYKSVVQCVEAEPTLNNHSLAMYAFLSARIGEEAKASELIRTLLANADHYYYYTYWSASTYNEQVETAGYVLHAMFQIGQDMTPAAPVSEYLIEQLNVGGVTPYTEAYAVGIHALYHYVLETTYRPHVSMMLTVSAANGYSSPRSVDFTITDENKFMYQHRVLENSTATKFLTTIRPGGIGCAVTFVKYSLNVNSLPPSYTFQVNATTVSPSDCSAADVTICVWNTEYYYAKTVVIDITLLSGYAVDVTSLQGHLCNGAVQAYAVGANSLLILLQVIPAGSCFRFRQNRITVVGNLQPAPVTVTDYYNSVNNVSALYTAGDNCAEPNRMLVMGGSYTFGASMKYGNPYSPY